MNNALAIVENPTETSLQLPCTPFEIPVQDFPEFMRLTRDQRKEITLQLEAMAYISAAANVTKACEEVATIARNLYPDLNGFSASRLYAKHSVWRKGGFKVGKGGKPVGPRYEAGDWRYFIPNYTNGGKALPVEFIDYLVTEYARTTRENDSVTAIHRRLKIDWLAGKPIPGYGTADEWYPKHGRPRPRGSFIRDKDLPAGWSVRNIGRAIDKALPRRQLRRAAQGQLNRVENNWSSQLLRDRSKLRPFELMTIDDVRLDLQCRMYLEGKWQIVYIDALFHMDVATGYILGYGIKGRATRSEFTERGRAAGTKMSINSDDVRHLLLVYLDRFGIPPYDSYFLFENATAKPSNADELAFLSLLQHLHFDYSGMGRGKLLKSGFAEEWGRPGVKGWIESWFRLLHTSINHLQGTTGRRYELTRGDQGARVKHTISLLNRAEKLIDGALTPEHPLAKQIIFPMMTVDEVNLVVGEMVDALNWRTDHRLQGFDRVFEFQDRQGLWLPERALNKLSPDERVGVELTPRMETPAERFRRLLTPYAGKFQQIDPITKSVLYLNKRKVTVSNGKITVNDQRITSDAMIFLAQDLRDFEAYEGRKEAVLAYISDDYSHAVLADVESGRCIGTMERQGRVGLLDFDALNKRAGQVHRDMEAELAVVRTYLAQEDNRLTSINEHNDTVLNDYHPRGTVQAAFATHATERVKSKQLARGAFESSALLDDEPESDGRNDAPHFNGSDLL